MPRPQLAVPATFAKRIGHRLTDLRQQAGLSQAAAATAAGISRNHLQLLEAGLSDRGGTPANPRLSTLISLTSVFGVTIAELIGDPD